MRPASQSNGRSKRMELWITIAAIVLAIVGFALYFWWGKIFTAERDITSHNNDVMLQNRYRNQEKIFKK